MNVDCGGSVLLDSGLRVGCSPHSHNSRRPQQPAALSQVRLTIPLIDACRTPARGFTKATTAALGVKFPLVTGWVRRLVGTTISQAQYDQALAGRFIRHSGRKARSALLNSQTGWEQFRLDGSWDTQNRDSGQTRAAKPTSVAERIAPIG